MTDSTKINIDLSKTPAEKILIDALEFYADKEKYVAAGQVYDDEGNCFKLQDMAIEALAAYRAEKEKEEKLLMPVKWVDKADLMKEYSNTEATKQSNIPVKS